MSQKTATGKRKAVPMYSKAQILASNQFTALQRDVLGALLENGQTYTMADVQKTLNKFLKRKVM